MAIVAEAEKISITLALKTKEKGLVMHYRMKTIE